MTISAPNAERRHWMSVLARASVADIERRLAACPKLPEHVRLRGPETGLVMTRGRAGGGGAPFNLGEISVTRCTVRTESGLVGHAYVAGRDAGRAELAARVDAGMQDAALLRGAAARGDRAVGGGAGGGEGGDGAAGGGDQGAVLHDGDDAYRR